MKKLSSKSSVETEKYSKRIRPLTIFMLMVIACTAVLSGLWYYDAFGKNVRDCQVNEQTDKGGKKEDNIEEMRELQVQKEEKMNMLGTYVGDDPDMQRFVIVNENDAMEALLAIQGNLGVISKEDNYELVSVNEKDDSDVYVYQQYYNGVEVYGHTLKLQVNKFGKIELFNSGYATIGDCDLDVLTSEKEACDSVKKFLKQTYQISDEEVDIFLYGNIIYFSENAVPLVGYLYDIYYKSFSTLRILVDGRSAEIVSAYDTAQYEMVETELQGQKVKQTLDVYQKAEKEYLLEDNKRNIFCYNDSEYDIGSINTQTILYHDRLFKDKPKSAIDALANIERAYDYFFETFDREGIDGKNGQLDIVDNVISFDKKTKAQKFNNAAWCPIEGKSCGAIIMYPLNNVKYTLSQWLDIMGHEYTHGIVNSESKLGMSDFGKKDRQKSIQYTINEGIADIFGELIEDWSDGQSINKKSEEQIYNNSCDWILGDESFGRNINECENSDELLTDISEYKEWETDCHDASTLVSYPAYLMAHGINGNKEKIIDTKTLGKLWYGAIGSLHNLSDFSNLRFTVEMQALNMNSNGKLSDQQLECVIDAFDRVGIEPEYALCKVTPGSKMTVYSHDNKICENYHITITKGAKKVADYDVKESHYLFEGITPGIYRIILSETKDEGLQKSFIAIVNDNNSDTKCTEYENEWNIYTDFGSLEKEVSLVLDVSGSMNGTPMEEIRKSAVRFIDTVLRANANTKISIITYASEASVVARKTSDRQELYRTINAVQAEGGTNMYDAMQAADNIFERNNNSAKIIVFMSDGAPNEGKKEAGSYEAALMRLSNTLKDEDSVIYTFGFYHNLNGSELNTCKKLMEEIASEGYAYVVSNSGEVESYLNDIALQVNGKRYIYIKIACPVEVTVTKKGEILSSIDSIGSTRTEWGTLSHSDSINGERILRLTEGDDYEICITGTGDGEMNYTIGFVDAEGEYSDMRTFEDIPITPYTTILTNTSSKGKTILKVDTDGDGKFDLQYKAAKNQLGVIAEDMRLPILVGIASTVLMVLVAIRAVIAVKRFQTNKICSKCGKPVLKAADYCGECGALIVRKRLFLPEKIKRRKQHKAVWITKLVVIWGCLLLSSGICLLKSSAADVVYNQIRNQSYEAGRRLYQMAVSDSGWNRLYLSIELNNYLRKVQQACHEGTYRKEDAQSLYIMVSDLQLDTISEMAEQYLLNLRTLDY